MDIIEKPQKRVRKDAVNEYNLQRPTSILIFLSSSDITNNWSGTNNSKFDISVYPFLENYNTLTLESCSIKQIYTANLQYLNMSLIGFTQSATSKPAAQLPAQLSFAVPLQPYGIKAAGTYCTYDASNGGSQQTVKITNNTSITTFNFVLMDESLQQLQWDGATTGWEFYIVLKATQE